MKSSHTGSWEVRLKAADTASGLARFFQVRRSVKSAVETLLRISLVLPLVVLNGCSHFHPKPEPEYVYVLAKQTYLRDRVAAVSNRTATVTNGQRLRVLEHGRRFLNVQTSKGETGWVEERTLVPQSVADGFAALERDHLHDPEVATAVLRDELYMHLKPGRDTDKLYLLPEGEKLKLLARASVEKADASRPVPRVASLSHPAAITPANPQAGSSPKAGTSQTGPAQTGSNKTGPDKTGSDKTGPDKTGNEASEGAPPPPMEDWWLVRDAEGQTGWLLSRRLDVDVPDAIAKYSEGQRIVGAYVLTTVHDPDIDQAAGGNIPEYVTVLSAPHDGLPYDFDQVRVYIWNLKKHRYETAYRERNIEGFLPVALGTDNSQSVPRGGVPAGPMPVFSVKLAAEDSGPTVIDPVTGISKPSRLIVQNFRLEGNLVRRILPPSQTASPIAGQAVSQQQEAHPEAVPEKKKGRARAKARAKAKARGKKRHRR